MEGPLAMYLTNKSEKITLPDTLTVMHSPVVSVIAVLDAILAVSKTAIICDTPPMEDLMNMADDNVNIPSHLFAAHHIVDIIERLRLEIREYKTQTINHIHNPKSQDFPF